MSNSDEVPPTPGVELPANLRDAIAAFLRERYGDAARRHSLQVKLLHDIVARCLVTYSIDGGTVEGLSVVVKAFRDGPRAAYARDVLQQLRAAGFGPDAHDGIFVPEPLGLVDGQLLVMEDVRAPKATAVAKRRPSKSAVQAATALAKLHATPVETPRRLSTERLLTGLREGWDDPNAHKLIDAVEAHLQDLGPAEPVAIHTDYHLGQLLIGRGRVCLLDTGNLMLGDPAFDLANFRVSALTRSRPRPVDPFLETFTSTYVSLRGPDVLARLPTYEAIVLLRRAVKRAERSDAVGASRLLSMAQARLGEPSP